MNSPTKTLPDLVISIPTFGRLSCLERCLMSLATNREVAEADVLIYPDFVPDEELEQIEAIFNKSGLSGGVQDRPSKRLYGCANIIRSVREAMANGYRQMIKMDADLTVSPSFVKQLMAALDWSSGPCQSNVVCMITREEKKPLERTLRKGMNTGTNLALTRDHWTTIQPILCEYTDRFLTVNPYMLDRPACLQWYADRASEATSSQDMEPYRTGNVGVSADGTTLFALRYHGIQPYTLHVNRAVHGIEPGQNHNPKTVEVCAATHLDILEDDATRTDFVLAD